jgi:hypothetical protein
VSFSSESWFEITIITKILFLVALPAVGIMQAKWYAGVYIIPRAGDGYFSYRGRKITGSVRHSPEYHIDCREMRQVHCLVTSALKKHSRALVQIIADSAVCLQIPNCSSLFNFDSPLRLTRLGLHAVPIATVLRVACDG